MLGRVKKWYYRLALASWDIEFRLKLKRRGLKKHIVKGSLVVIPLALISYGLVAFDNVPPHQFSDSECLGCHFTIPQAGDPRPYRFVQPVDALCRKCHDKLGIVSHVVNVAPTIAVPGDFPLDERGFITCSTCHDPHIPALNPAGEKTYFLRAGLAGRGRCGVCHQSELSSGGSVTHRPAMNRAHGFSHYTVLDPDVKLDSLSIVCIDCHESATAPCRSSPCAGVWRHGEDIGISHPIGTDYEEAASRDRELRPLEELDKRLQLFDGRIGCCTCHNPYTPGGGMSLRIGDKDGFQDLCMACHIR